MLIWIDTETTGLDPRGDRLLEIGVIVTDDALVEVARWQRVLRNARIIDLRDLSPIVQQMHARGLWCESLLSDLSDEGADLALRDFILATPGAKGAPAAGNTVGFDRGFLQHYCPRAYAEIGYRSVDVSSLTELARRFWPGMFAEYEASRKREIPHRVMGDLEASIALLRTYLSWLSAHEPSALPAGAH